MADARKGARFDPHPASLALLEALRDGESISALPDGAAPKTLAQGWRVARAVIEALELPVVGFRALADGTTGPLLAPRLVPGSGQLPLSALPGIAASAACFFPLARALPASSEPYSMRRVLAALGPGRAAIDLAAWRTRTPPANMPARIADLGGLGMLVLAAASRAAAKADPRALRVSWNDAPAIVVDATPQLLAAAEVARQAGGLPAGAALVAAGLLSSLVPAAGEAIAVRIVNAGRAAMLGI